MGNHYEFFYRGYSIQYKIINAPENIGVESFLMLTKAPACFGEIDGDLFLDENEIKRHLDYLLGEEHESYEGNG
ncbi:hypothetical protein [Bacillus velezensis]|uniref:hypothetical protein n=1 Tax=Bacillus velezensis TaxID=492670 RepID=UPI00241698A6|nr:hypothetical protein [Bacillus velezensis]WFP05435.1 hypothetical protein JEQ22_20215 [Bacillus velezensis]